MSMLWAQAMPFVALRIYKKNSVDNGDLVRINGHFNITNSTSQLPDENNYDERESGGELEKSTIAVLLGPRFRDMSFA